MQEPPDEHEPPEEAAEPVDQPEGDLDLLAVGLVVFFVTLIVIVGALLLLPAVL